MATLYTNGIEELLMNLDDLANLSSDAMKEMVKAMADVIRKSQGEHAASELHGPYYRGYTHDNVIAKPVTKTAAGAKTTVTWTASVSDEYHKHGIRVAEIAFLNQYGTSKMGAREFITHANEQSQEEAVTAAETIFNNYLASAGF